jgi:NitT/TauT family transport system permease protein
VAWIPLAILMFPSSEGCMIFITFIGALFPILLNTIHGVEASTRASSLRRAAWAAALAAVFRGDRCRARRPAS